MCMSPGMFGEACGMNPFASWYVGWRVWATYYPPLPLSSGSSFVLDHGTLSKVESIYYYCSISVQNGRLHPRGLHGSNHLGNQNWTGTIEFPSASGLAVPSLPCHGCHGGPAVGIVGPGVGRAWNSSFGDTRSQFSELWMREPMRKRCKRCESECSYWKHTE